MPKHGKRYLEAAKLVDSQKLYGPEEAIELAKKTAWANFNDSIEVHVRLGIDPRQADQAVRSTVVLPHGTGKEPRVLVFAAGEAAQLAEQAGADYVGAEDLVQQIQGGWLEFDAAIAMADQMGKVGGLGRILGRRGLMPNPRSGTVVRNPEDLPAVVHELKQGRVEFRNDRTGILHVVIGKQSFEDSQLIDNLFALLDAINRAKPQAAKGTYLRTLTITSTMGPGIKVDVTKAQEGAGKLAA